MTGISLRSARAQDSAGLADIFLAARHTAMPWLAQPHTDEETRRWVDTVLVPGGHVTVAERDGRLVGFADVADGWLHHLYVSPAHQAGGVGSALLAHAKSLEPNGFRLWAFQRNAPALAFYAGRGCVEVTRTDGAANEEREPDVLLRWSPA